MVQVKPPTETSNRMTLIGQGMSRDRAARTLVFAVVGGLAGTVLMDLVMVTTFVLVGAPADTFFTMVGEQFGDGALVGIALHNIVGLSGGLVFASVLVIGQVRIGNRNEGLKYGLAAGAVTIPLGCVPMAIWLGQPILDVVAFSLLPHLVWGLTLGWTVAFGLSKPGREAVPATGY